MNPLASEWAIKHRSDVCAGTQRPFASGESFYTLLFRDADGFRREDLSEEAWRSRNENILPFSFWKSRYQPAPPAPPETLAQETAEQLFRRLLSSNNAPPSACYVLAVMLERKRVLKQIKIDNPAKGREEDRVFPRLVGIVHADELPHGVGELEPIVGILQRLIRGELDRDVGEPAPALMLQQ